MQAGDGAALAMVLILWPFDRRILCIELIMQEVRLHPSMGGTFGASGACAAGLGSSALSFAASTLSRR